MAPQPTTSLVGRKADVKTIARLLVDEGRRLVTLTGVGGIGKTRLALAVLEATQDRWPDGTTFVDLSRVRDASEVLSVMASTCGAIPQGTESAADALARRFAGREALVVLDNFEQVVDAAPLVSDLLQRCAGLHMLVTSRIVLRVRGEREYTVEPLDADPSLELFV
jgi:predicted ATPase